MVWPSEASSRVATTAPITSLILGSDIWGAAGADCDISNSGSSEHLSFVSLQLL
jgi:hypothetical protein